MEVKIIAFVSTATGDHKIQMPLGHKAFDEALTTANILTGNRNEYQITDVTTNFESESAFEETVKSAIDIEELNYLAKRMDSFCNEEFEEFFNIADAKESLDIKDLINLTFTKEEYNIFENVHDLDDLGRHFVDAEAPKLDDKIIDNINFEGLGGDLQTEQRGEFTHSGYCCNFNDKFEELYNGKLFPQYRYEDTSLTILLVKDVPQESSLNEDATNPNQNFAKGVYIDLPASKLAIDRALHRIGAESLKECHVEEYHSEVHPMLERTFSPKENVEQLSLLAEHLEKLGPIDGNKMHSFYELLDKTDKLESVDDVIEFTKAFNENRPWQAPPRLKPDSPLIGADSNIFNLMGIAARTLKQSNMPNEAKEMCGKIINCQNYDDALGVLTDYVNPVEQGHMQAHDVVDEHETEQNTDAEMDDDQGLNLTM